MAYTETALSAADIALAVADKPILAGVNPATAPTARLREGTDPGWDTDESDGDYPAARMLDGLSHLPARGANANAIYGAVFNFPATAAYDVVAITGHNFDDLTLTSIVYQVADDAAFMNNLLTVVTFANPSDGKRMISLDLRSGSYQYTGAHYGRIVVTAASSKPEFGEVFFLKRRQLAHNPNLPFDDFGPLTTRGSSFRSQSGVETYYAYSRGQRSLRLSLNPDNTTDQATLRAVYSDADHGASPVIWIGKPSSAPEEFLITNISGSDREFHMPLIGYAETSTSINLEEQGPEEFYFSREV